ncbi:hypothetical protein BR93DRAFT_969259 [Coniochaeta sp. PMI_546]|nr:hypothetical protein BR93DRAFT_969259 [Coniochaeta sp. PMI_546]
MFYPPRRPESNHRQSSEDRRRQERRRGHHHGVQRAATPAYQGRPARPDHHHNRGPPRPELGPLDHRQRAHDPPDSASNDAAIPTFHQPDANSNLTEVEHSASDASSDGGSEDAACLGCTRVARRRAALSCGHNWCRRCLRTLVRNALEGGDGAWPPRCCQEEPGEIQETVVEWLGDRGVLDLYRRRSAEMDVAVRDRVYCHIITCASFIPPAHHTLTGDRRRGGRTALCQQPGCNRLTCVDCGTQAHVGRPCPRDPDMEAVLQTIEAHGYQFCARCNTVVERIDGCNHITCGYQFCYMCGARWKLCNCPGYGGVRRRRPDRPRLEEAVRARITAAPPSVTPAEPRRGGPAGELGRPASQDGEERGRREVEDPDAARLAERIRMWALEDQEANQPAPALALGNNEQMRRWAQEDAEARALAEQMRMWIMEDADARRQAGLPQAQAPVPRRVPTAARSTRGVRDERPGRPGSNRGDFWDRRLPHPRAANLTPQAIRMGEPGDHPYHRPEPTRERGLQEQARLAMAERMRAQQQFLLGDHLSTLDWVTILGHLAENGSFLKCSAQRVRGIGSALMGNRLLRISIGCFLK